MPQCYDFLEFIGKRDSKHKHKYNQSDESLEKKIKILRKFKQATRLNIYGDLASSSQLKPETSNSPRQKTRIFLNKNFIIIHTKYISF